MEKTKAYIVSKKQDMIGEFPEYQKLTTDIFNRIGDLMEEDPDAASNKSRKLKLVFSCITDVLEAAREQDVKRKYVLGLFDILGDEQVVSWMKEKPGDGIEEYLFAVKGARAEVLCAQWSDESSKHWQRVISHFQKF